MIINAMPKSSGTALSSTISKIHNKNVLRGVTCYKKEGNIVEIRHGCMGDIRNEDIEKFKDKNTIYHEHIFPTKNNIKNLRDQKKVILLRDPEEILHSWWRSEKAGTHKKHPLLKKCKNEKDYVKNAKDLGALKIFQNFKQGWENSKSEKDLVIYYKDLISNPKETINKVEEHFGLPESKDAALLKMRYNRGSMWRKFAKKTYLKLHKIKPLVKLKRKLLPNFTFG